MDGSGMDTLGGEGFLSLRALSAYSGLSVRTLRTLIHRRIGPLPYYQVANKILVRRNEFDAWIRQFRHGTKSDRGDVDHLVDEMLGALTAQGDQAENRAHAGKER